MPLFLIGIAFIAPFFVSIAASVGDGFDFERRGIVDVKGKGPIETWFVLGRRGGDAATDAATAPDAQIAAAARGER